MKTGRIIVCGGRDYNDAGCIGVVLGLLFKGGQGAILVHGAATGADTLASKWADQQSIPQEAYPADWHRYGRSAGPIRNEFMASLGADLVVAFPGGAGTKHMVSTSKAVGIPVWEVRI